MTQPPRSRAGQAGPAGATGLQPGELWSSLLVRQALERHLSALEFARDLFGDNLFWNRDVDLGQGALNLNRMRISAEFTGVQAEDIARSTLQPWLKASRATAPTSLGVVPWVNASGLLRAGRRRAALQCCPACVAASPVALRVWRLAFVTWCERHDRPLLCRCPRCTAPLAPHLARQGCGSCYRCGADLRGWSVRSCASLSRASAGQERGTLLQRVMCKHFAQAERGDAQAAQSLVAGRYLAGLLLHRPAASGTQQLGFRPRLPARLEFLEQPQRHAAMTWLDHIYRGWPGSFRALAPALGLTQQSFARAPVLPNWLRGEVSRLPVGDRRSRSGPLDRLARQLEDLESREAPNWRVKRASLLLQAGSHGTR